MARTITVTDDDSGVVTTVLVERAEDGFTHVKEVRFTAGNGGGLKVLDLSVLRDFGLADPELPTAGPATMPAPGPAAAEPDPVAEPEQAATTGLAAKPAAKPAVKSGKEPGGAKKSRTVSSRRRPAKTLSRAGAGREYRKAPDVEALRELFAEHRGPSAVARALGVPLHTVQGWLRTLRAKGTDPTV